MASSTTKKVQVWRFDREPIAGFVNPNTYLTPVGIELLTVAGSILDLPWVDIRSIYFVKDFEKPNSPPPKRAFLVRPKLDGLWIRLIYRDGEQQEGVIPNDLLVLEGSGFTLTTPDFLGNNQKAFIPKTSVKEVQVLGVVGSPLKRPVKKPPIRGQFDLFPEEIAR